jgi:hypothetical protein
MLGANKHGRESLMERLHEFQTAAHKRGFVEVGEPEGGPILWLKKKAPDMVRETHQLICIDGLRNSATVYWMTVPGGVNSKTFRGVSALQEWFERRPEKIVQR